MNINKIKIYKSPIKLKEPFKLSLSTHEFAENIIINISTDEDIEGYGECSPFMMINGENMDTCFIVAQYLAKILIGKNPLQIDECCLLMDKLIYANNSIKSAFDMALYDIAATHAGLPLYKYLKGNNNKKIITDYTVSLDDAPKMASDAQKIVDSGFQVMKVKLGTTKEKDVERISKIREAIGYEMPIRIDANQGWNAEEALEILIALAPYKIQHCEEPIPRWNFMELPSIKKHSPIPIMADECCCDHHDAKRLIDLEACDLFNIKLGKCSGINKALKIIELAEKGNIMMQLGGFLESRLGFTAAAHLALTSNHIIHFDFDTPLMFEEDPVLGGITYNNKGVITITETPGLGAAIDEKYLNKQEKIMIE